MRVLFQAYDTFAQNEAGGVRTKIMALYDHLRSLGCEVDMFDKWKTKISDYDIIHFFKASYSHLGLMEYARESGKKIVLSSIVPLADSGKIRFHMLLNKFVPLHTAHDLTRRNFEMSDVIITESKSESAFIQRNYNISPSKLTALPNGVNLAFLHGDPDICREKFGLRKDFVLQVGRIDPNKNQLTTIRALNGSGIPLVIVGGADPSAPEYERKCRETADENTVFTGWISASDPMLPSLYAAAKTLVLPSINEIYGNVIMEGGIAGCSLSCSDRVPLADWGLDKYIDFFDPYSEQSLRNSIDRQFAQNVPCSQVEFFRNFFSWERIAKEHIGIYESLCHS